MITIHPSATVSPLADLEESIRGTRIVVGENSKIDSFVKIKPAGGIGDVIIGKSVIINSGCVFYSGNGIQIGDFVAIAANCTFAPANHEFSTKSSNIQDQGFLPSRGGIIIENDVWIGANCVLLDGAILSEGCVVGAGSLVRDKLKSYTVYAGNPLRIIGERK